MSRPKHKGSELSNSELKRHLGCSEEEFDQFEEVDLSYLSSNTLTIRYETIPALDCLTNLERLTICNHNISDLSPIIVLRKLKYVNLSNNNISNVRPLVQLYLLEELHLDHNNIYKFPRDLYKLHNLRVLSLSHNKITYDTFQDILALSKLESLDLTYNPVTMRDKETRRDLVFFLHNRLHHFQLFNGIHISTLYARVSCGKDYLSDILDNQLLSPSFFVPSQHILTIGEQKNLLGKPREDISPIPMISDVSVSPFCLDGEQLTAPRTPTFCKRIGEKASISSPSKSVFSLNDCPSEEISRNRSTSMFETLHSPMEGSSTPTEQTEEKPPERRRRTFSVHDVILQNQSAEEKPAISMFDNKDIRMHTSVVEKGSFGKVNVESLPIKTEERKPLFSKTRKNHSDSTTVNRMFLELKRMNESLVSIIQSQQRMENRLNRLETLVTAFADKFQVEQKWCVCWIFN